MASAILAHGLRFLRAVAPAWRLGGYADDDAVGFAVRRDWPDGTHDLYGWQSTPGAVQRRIDRTQASPRWGQWRQGALMVVPASRRAVRAHSRRDPCRVPDCLTLVAVAAGAPSPEAG